MTQIIGLVRTMRPRQWIKNGLIFVPLLFDRKLFELNYLLLTAAGFALFCMARSSVYIMNDLIDIEADRAHPTKRNRPLPSGKLSRGFAIAMTLVLVVVAVPLSYLLKPWFAAIVGGYLVLQVAYSFVLKRIVIIDVLTIATGFLLTVGGGVLLVDVLRFSPWLYLFTTMGALFLGFGKRRQELILLEGEAQDHRAILAHYSIPLLDEIIGIVMGMTILTYALYTFSAEGLPQNHLMMLTLPFVIYGLFRYLYLIHVRGEGGAPEEVALSDRPMQATVVLWGLSVTLILYFLSDV